MNSHPVRRPLIVQLVVVNLIALMCWLLVVNLLLPDMTPGLLNGLVVVLIAAQLAASIWIVVNATREKNSDQADRK